MTAGFIQNIESVQFIGGDGAQQGGGGASEYNASAVMSPEEDPIRLAREGLLTGVTTYDKVLVSFWARIANAFDYAIAGTDTQHFFLTIRGDLGAGLALEVYNAGYSLYDMVDSLWPTLDNEWHHFMVSYDRGNLANCFSLVDGEDITTTRTSNLTGDPSLVDGGVADFLIGGSPGWSNFVGDFADLYIAFGQWLDLSVSANVEKFRSTAGKPVFLGADGSAPTGVAPTIFLSGDATGFPVNKGTGGGFTLTQGTLTDAPTSPSDLP